MSTVPEHGEEYRSRSQPSRLTTSDYATGICLLLFVVFLWTFSSFVTQHMFVGGYQKPFMMTYLTSASFTLYLLPPCLRRLFRTMSHQRNINYRPLAQDFSSEHDSLAIHSFHEASSRLTLEETAKLALHMCFLWFAADCILSVALLYTSVASATILSSMGAIFTLAVGTVFRVETLTLMKVAAVLASLGGVTLVTLSDSSSSLAPEPTVNTPAINFLVIFGDILALLAALFYSMYTVLLKVQIKEESRIDAPLFLGCMGLFNVLLLWPVALLLHWAGIELLEFPSTKETVVTILIILFISFAGDYLYVIAMLKTTPLVVTVGLRLNIPLAVFGDYLLGKPITFQVLVGAVLATGAFIAVGVQNSKQPEEDEVLLAGGRAGEEIRAYG